MRKLALSVFGLLVVVAIVFFAIGVIPKSSGTADNRSNIETRGLPEHGILVIAPGDPTFDSLTADYLKSTPGVDLDALKRSSVFVVNKSGRAIAAMDVKWELLQPDGQTIAQHQARQGPLEVVSDGDSSHFVEVMSATGSQLFSVLIVDTPRGVGFRMGGGEGSAATARHLSNSVKQTISVDGVLFVDGTFAGPDTRGYFESLREELEAKREAFEEIARALSGDAQAMRRLELLASGKVNSYRDQIKQQFASIVLADRKRLDSGEVLQRVNAVLSNPRIALRRL